jgi:hypothetical protein
VYLSTRTFRSEIHLEFLHVLMFCRLKKIPPAMLHNFFDYPILFFWNRKSMG